MTFREIRILPHEFAENINGGSSVAFLVERQSQLHPRIRVLGMETDGITQLADGFVQTSRLRRR